MRRRAVFFNIRKYYCFNLAWASPLEGVSSQRAVEGRQKQLAGLANHEDTAGSEQS